MPLKMSMLHVFDFLVLACQSDDEMSVIASHPGCICIDRCRVEDCENIEDEMVGTTSSLPCLLEAGVVVFGFHFTFFDHFLL